MRTRPDKITVLEIGNRSIERDGHGYLIDPSQWDRDVAKLIAKEEEISLGEDHWAIISFMRDYFDEHGIPADARFVFSLLAEHKDIDKKDSRKLFFELFPYGYVKQSCKIAGMRQPRAWSTG